MIEQSHDVQAAYKKLQDAIQQEQAAKMLVKNCEQRIRMAHEELADAIARVTPDVPCTRFVAMIHDLEATGGP